MRVTLGYKDGSFWDGTDLSAVLTLEGTPASSQDYRIIDAEEASGNVRRFLEIQNGIVIKTWFGSASDSYPEMPERYASAVVVQDDKSIVCDLGLTTDTFASHKLPPRNWPLARDIWTTVINTMSEIPVT